MPMTTGRKILVIKHGALGDIVQALDGFASLRAGHKDDHLAVLTSPGFAGLLSMMPYFDEVLVDHRAGPLQLARNVQLWRVLRRNWDRVYDFQTSRRTRRYLDHVLRDGTDIIGQSRRASHPLPDMTGMNNRDRMLETARLGGCPMVEADPSWLTGGKTAENPDSKAGKTAVLVPGCSPVKPEKRWPEQHYASLARLLHDAGYRVTLVGTDVDRAAGDAIMAAFPDAHDRIGKTSLMELAGELSRASLVIGNDTGPVFLAARLGAPTLMLMSRHTDPAMSAPTGPSFGGLSCGWLKQENIADIRPGDVMAALDDLPDAAD